MGLKKQHGICKNQEIRLGLYTKDTNELFYSVPNKEDKYDPEIKYNTKLINDHIALLGDEMSEDLMKNNKHIKLMVYNNKYYKEYDVVLTSLPVLNIRYAETEKNIAGVTQKDGETTGELDLYNNQSNRIERLDYEMHVRGATSAEYPKKGFKLSLKDKNQNKKYYSLLDMRYDDDWILYAAYNDQERVRNVFSSRIWYDCCASDNQFNVKNGMYYKYVELFMNNTYQGLYALGFPIDVKQLDIKDGEYLFKKDQHFIENEFYYDDETSVPYYEVKNKSYDEKTAQEVLKNYFNTLSTSKDKEELYSLSDIDNILDFYIYNIFVQNADGVLNYNSKNLYLSFKKNDQGLVSLYSPWDLDQTFGNNWDWDEQNYIDSYGLKNNDNKFEFNMSNIGSLKKLSDKNINKLLKEKYKSLKEQYLNQEYLNGLISEYEKDIFGSGAYIRDVNKWPDSSKDNYKDLSKFKKFVNSRLTSTDAYFNNLK